MEFVDFCVGGSKQKSVLYGKYKHSYLKFNSCLRKQPLDDSCMPIWILTTPYKDLQGHLQ